MAGKTKVAKGINYSDVSNIAVRNILFKISELIHSFTENDMEETLKYFDGCCPYTGRKFTEEELESLNKDNKKNGKTVDTENEKKDDNKKANIATDHIVPANKFECGLNVMGNLVLVDSKANSKKADKSLEEFLLDPDHKFDDILGNDMEIRKKRYEKIKDFQKKYNYDPEKFKEMVSPILQSYYDEIRHNQEEKILEIANEINGKLYNIDNEKLNKIVSSDEDENLQYHYDDDEIPEEEFQKLYNSL